MRLMKFGMGAASCLLLMACGEQSTAPQGEQVQQIVADAPKDAVVEGPERVILAFGDSLFAGYNLETDEGYPEELQRVLRARGINAKVIDAGVSGDTTAAGLQRLDFVLDNLPEGVDLALVELGGNDLLRGIAPDQTRANLTQIIEKVQARRIPVVLMGMRAPPNGGPQFQQQFDAIYPALAEKYGATLVPFFMQPLAEDPSLLLDDHIHPTAQGVKAMVAAQVDTIVGALPAEK
ncbi:arylesterase [Aurantiacibacter xanthus]|uniref:Arylesterase n=1 Tax=Aurantiacibacter xanthus TaxID=1784712 RepID=A0A3A1P5W1_9SPHN|nr:arylesterase [Aurantiacibacter xanthus]